MTKKDLEHSLLELAKKIEVYKDKVTCEENTKNWFISPFLRILGYEIENPEDIICEYTCDIGTKKGEKVDYAIFDSGNLSLILEAKDCRNDLTKENVSQLFRYFAVSNAKIAILTNGIEYQFFTDLDKDNQMDLKPFKVLVISRITDDDIEFLLKLSKGSIDTTKIKSDAKLLSFDAELLSWLENQSRQLSPKFMSCMKAEIPTYDLSDSEIQYRVSKILGKKFDITPLKSKQEVSSKSKVKEAEFKSRIYSLDECDKSICTGTKLIALSVCGVLFICNSWTDAFSAMIDYLTMNKKLLPEEIYKRANDIFFSSGDSLRTPKENKTVFYEANASAIACIRNLSKLLNLFDIKATDVQLGICSKEEYKEYASKGMTNEAIFKSWK